MPDAPPPAKPPNPLAPLVEAGAQLIRHKLEETPLHPHVFDEIAVASKAIHKACTALDPVLNLPGVNSSKGPLAPSSPTEGAGASAMRQLVGALENLGGGGKAAPKASRKDLMAAIVLAEREGLSEDAERLRRELYGDDDEIDDDLLPPQRKVDLANDLLAQANEKTLRAKVLLGSVKPHEIVDVETVEGPLGDELDPRIKPGCVVTWPCGGEMVLKDDEHVETALAGGAVFVRSTPLPEGDYAYSCDDAECQCGQ